MNACCFRPQSRWEFVAAAVRISMSQGLNTVSPECWVGDPGVKSPVLVVDRALGRKRKVAVLSNKGEE